jgi:hypothetical protein
MWQSIWLRVEARDISRTGNDRLAQRRDDYAQQHLVRFSGAASILPRRAIGSAGARIKVIYADLIDHNQGMGVLLDVAQRLDKAT